MRTVSLRFVLGMKIGPDGVTHLTCREDFKLMYNRGASVWNS